MHPPAKPVGVAEFRDSSTMAHLSRFWTSTDIADSASAGGFGVSSGAAGPKAEPEVRRRRIEMDSPRLLVRRAHHER